MSSKAIGISFAPSKASGPSRRTLGSLHIWALGVGIVLVGDFMGWNLTIMQGGSFAAIIALWVMGIMYAGQVLMLSEMSLAIPGSGSQYEIAKLTLGPLAAFNVGLMQVFEYIMLEAGDIIVIGKLLSLIIPGIKVIPVSIFFLLVLTYINYRSTEGALRLNLVLAGASFACVVLLFFATCFYDPASNLLELKELTNGMPYGPLGIIAAIGYGCWFFLGIEGTVIIGDKCKVPERSIPLGSIVSLATLLISGTITFFVCSGLIDSTLLGTSIYPLFEAAIATGKLLVIVILFVATILACLASANGCMTASRAVWAQLSKDSMLPSMFAQEHPKRGTPHRSIIFLAPIALAFALTGMLGKVVIFSIFSALMIYLLTCVMMVRFRRMYPKGSIERPFTAPLFPALPIVTGLIVLLGMFGLHLNYSISLIAAVLFYLAASIWFIVRRQKYVDGDRLLSKGLDAWGKPKGF